MVSNAIDLPAPCEAMRWCCGKCQVGNAIGGLVYAATKSSVADYVGQLSSVFIGFRTARLSNHLLLHSQRFKRSFYAWTTQ
jgi:hypothetical protein